MDFHKSLSYPVQSTQTTRLGRLCSRVLIIDLSEAQITGFIDEFYDEKQKPKCSSKIYTQNYAQKTIEKNSAVVDAATPATMKIAFCSKTNYVFAYKMKM